LNATEDPTRRARVGTGRIAARVALVVGGGEDLALAIAESTKLAIGIGAAKR
jgi:hypothetical protein